MSVNARSRPGSREPGAAPTARVRSLLVAVDLTPSSDRAIGRLSQLPLADDARVTLLHVVPGSLPARPRRMAVRDARRALAAEARHLRKSLSANVSVTPLVKVGAAAGVICASATRSSAELIVMGRGSGRALREAFLGSTAERVIRLARLPVLVVRSPPRRAYARPALALALDQAGPDAVRLVLRLVPPPRPRVAVIHAYQDAYHELIYPSLSEAAAERKRQLRREATGKLLRMLAAALSRAGVQPGDVPSWKFHVRYGSPRGIVGTTVRRIRPDLLVLGTRARTGAAHLLLGTVAGDLLRRARCDVLLVPPASSRT